MNIEGIETTHYMEMFWPVKDEQTGLYKTTINQVLDRDPLIYNNSNNAGIMLGFRFYDVRTVIISDTDKVIGEPSNYSPMYYFGKRLSIENMRDISSLKETVTSMESQGSKTAILCTCGAIITNPSVGDLTVEECQQLQEKQANKDRVINLQPKVPKDAENK